MPARTKTYGPETWRIGDGMPVKIRVAIFSYNRPDHLANCLQSLRDLWPGADVVVYDDNSKHPGMSAVFEKFGVPVVNCPGGSGRHGALYSNMQRAFEEASAAGCTYLLTLQDDLQLVRPFSDEILKEYEALFSSDPAVTELHPCFKRTPAPQRPAKKAKSIAQPNEVNPHRPFKSYLDVGFFSVPRLEAVGWNFDVEGPQVVSGELTLSVKASKLGMKMKAPRTPFMMHVPFPHLYRHRIRLPRLSALSKKIFRYEYMTKEDIARMDARPESELAIWRNFLRVEGATWFDRWLMSTKNDAKIMQ
ncbi:MAG TPA: glycosyltransferase [Paracoccaceae bacterium]|nr:glycosyltransferase [Paracoccaceae bacterium]